jgi:PAT family beta-lactamase induction signal transducer AmpG
VTAIAFVLTFRAGDFLLFAMNSKLLESLGLDTRLRGIVSGGLGTTMSIVGAILGGWLLSNVKVQRAIPRIAVLQSLAILLYVGLAALRPPLPVIAVAVALEQLIAGVGAAALVIFILRMSDGPFKATHFAMGTALTGLAAMVAVPSGFVVNAVGYPWFFTIAFFASIPGVVLAFAAARTTLRDTK